MNNNTKNIYLVEDNELFAQTVKMGLSREEDLTVTIFGTGEELLDYLDNRKGVPDIIVLDYLLNSFDRHAKNGAQILELLRLKYKDRISCAPIIMLSSSTDVKEAVDLLKKGAKDYILKDEAFLDNLTKSINNIIELKQLRMEMGNYKSQVHALKKRLIITLGVIILFAVSLGGYFIWFDN